MADKREPLPRFALKGVKMTINVDADYQIVRTRRTNNVVGIVEGSDPNLKDTYVAFGAHYDHVGYREGRRTGGRWRGSRRMHGPGATHARSRRRHQQWRRRRWVRDGGADGARKSVCDWTETEAVTALRLARGRGKRAPRVAVSRRLPGRAARQDRRAAQHRHDRQEPMRRSGAVEHRLRRRGGPHQHRAAQRQRGCEPVAVEAVDDGLRDERSGRSRNRSTRGAITTATP